MVFQRDCILFLGFIECASFGVLVVAGIGVFEEGSVNMDHGSFQSASFDVAQRTWSVNSSWPESEAKLTHPALSRNFS